MQTRRGTMPATTGWRARSRRQSIASATRRALIRAIADELHDALMTCGFLPRQRDRRRDSRFLDALAARRPRLPVPPRRVAKASSSWLRRSGFPSSSQSIQTPCSNRQSQRHPRARASGSATRRSPSSFAAVCAWWGRPPPTRWRDRSALTRKTPTRRCSRSRREGVVLRGRFTSTTTVARRPADRMVRPRAPRAHPPLHAQPAARGDRAGQPGRLHAVPLQVAARRSRRSADRSSTDCARH